jgi:hypothetical protein
MNLETRRFIGQHAVAGIYGKCSAIGDSRNDAQLPKSASFSPNGDL